ncbi:MAG: hypothetical protein PHW03_05390 [Eubacteriales bacterium]|nr:hypothetical protein [Eubacteriales bacterium]
MEGKINKSGNLFLIRGGLMKPQYCPFTNTDQIDVHCGDWCPHFGEPTDVDQYDISNLNLCHNKTLYFPAGDFTDERTSK